jgi:hypothetical protein
VLAVWMAWSTRARMAFARNKSSSFTNRAPALTTVLRLHTNDLVMKTLLRKTQRLTESGDLNPESRIETNGRCSNNLQRN